MAQYALASDLGGTQLRVALVARDGNVTHRSSQPTDARRGRDDLLERFTRVLETTAAHVERQAIAGIGVAQAAPTNSDDGTMYNPPHLPGWDGFSAKAHLRASAWAGVVPRQRRHSRRARGIQLRRGARREEPALHGSGHGHWRRHSAGRQAVHRRTRFRGAR